MKNRHYSMQESIKPLQRIDEAIQTWQTKSNDRYSHIDKSDIDKVYRNLVEKQKWYDQTANRFNSLKPHEDPTVLCLQIKQEQDNLERDCWTIFNKPKPRVELPKDTPADASKKYAPPSDSHQQQGPPPPGKKSSPLKKPNDQQSSSDFN